MAERMVECTFMAVRSYHSGLALRRSAPPKGEGAL